MNRLLPGLAAFCLLAGPAAGAFAQPQEVLQIADPPAKDPGAVIASWPKPAAAAARAMIEKYGPPARYYANALVWVNNGPWRRTVVRRRSRDFLEQSILYEYRPEDVVELKRFDPRLEFDGIRREVTARSDSEPSNVLALNLVDEMSKGTRTVESARDEYARTERLEKAGKSSPYTQGFLFKGHSYMGKIYYP